MTDGQLRVKKLLKYLSAFLLGILFIFTLSEFSPIFDFAEPKPFSGPDIYNPYSQLDTSIGWKRANFHTHTRVDHIFNECPEYPDAVYEAYRKFGYDILTFSNHNELTRHPVDSLQVDLYEHGFNLFKLHNLVFNPSEMILYDAVFPFLRSQKQFKYDYLSRNADFIVMNHPDRTATMNSRVMRSLTGYRVIECECGSDLDCRRWDEALSAGHYSVAIADDDNHSPNDTWRIARRCSWQNVSGASYSEIKRALLSGCGYSMQIPDFGEGDWETKYRENADLPEIRWIGMCGEDTVKVEFDREAGRILAVGQDHVTLDSAVNATTLACRFRPEDSYVRFAAYFDNGVKIYTNAFARYDARVSGTPYVETPHPVDWPLTILFNLALLSLASLCVFALRKLL